MKTEIKVRIEKSVVEANGWVEAGVRVTCEQTIEDCRKTRLVGCPLGRGDSEEEAIQDFTRRVNSESKMDIVAIVVDRRED